LNRHAHFSIIGPLGQQALTRQGLNARKLCSAGKGPELTCTGSHVTPVTNPKTKRLRRPGTRVREHGRSDSLLPGAG